MYEIPSFEAVRAAYLRDVKNVLPDAATDGDSDHYVRASATASAVDGLYHFLLWIARQVLPDTADTDYLERHCALRGILRKPATPAEGTVTAYGTPGAVVPAGEALREVATGLTVLTSAQGVVGQDGQVVLSCQASMAGLLATVYADTPVTFTQAPAGLTGQAWLTISGGEDQETDAELLARLLDYLAHPPGGGNAHDYKQWAESVAGIERAYVFPSRRGLGTVDIAVLGSDGPAAPSAIAAAQALIDAKRPAACKDVWVLSPTPLAVDVTVAVRLDAKLGTLATVAAQLEPALVALFADLSPGAIVYRSRIEAVVSGLTGVVDRVVRLPAANVQAVVSARAIERPSLGQVLVEVL